MNKFDLLLSNLSSLNTSDLEFLSEKILNLLSDNNNLLSIKEEDVCSCKRCGSVAIVKYGKDKNGKQRYKCKDCNTLFSPTSYSVISQTHKPLSVWKQYIKLLVVGAPLWQCAMECGISVRTAFIWRHKILGTLPMDQEGRMLSGIIELDDMFMKISFKGNHSKSKRFTMPRMSYKRGSDNKQHACDRACVMFASERNGQAYGEVLGTGAASIKMLSHAFDRRVLSESICISDKSPTIKKYFSGKGIELVQVKSCNEFTRTKSSRVVGAFHIQHVNNMHYRFRGFINGYFGVATKYLNNYLNLFVWLENHKATSYREHGDMINKFLAKKGQYICSNEIFSRPAIPMIA